MRVTLISKVLRYGTC